MLWEFGRKGSWKPECQKLSKLTNFYDKKSQEIGGIDFDEYVKDGGYQTLRKCYDNKISVDEVIDKLRLAKVYYKLFMNNSSERLMRVKNRE